MTTHDEIWLAWDNLHRLCKGIIPSRIGLNPEPESFEAIAGDLRLLATKVDELIEAYGRHVAENSPSRVCIELFQGQLAAALDGQAIHEIDCAAEDVREQQRERV